MNIFISSQAVIVKYVKCVEIVFNFMYFGSKKLFQNFQKCFNIISPTTISITLY